MTKVHPRSYSPRQLQLDLELSAYKLRKEEVSAGVLPLDAVLLHAPYCWRGHCSREQESHTWQNAWKLLVGHKHNSAGAGASVSIRYIGVSNFDMNLLQQLILVEVDISTHECTGADTACNGPDASSSSSSHPHTQPSPVYPDLIQNWMDPYHQDRHVRRFCQIHGIQYMAYSSFGTQWNKGIHNPVLTSPVLLEIASRNGVAVTKVILTWLKQLHVVSLPKSTSSTHIEANHAVLGSDFVLSDADMGLIESLDGTIGTPWD